MSTHKPEQLHADNQCRQATGTIQWLLEKRRDIHPYTPNNLMEMFICGEEAFKAIEKDIRNAKESVDIVCWGFDPGMELVRSDGASHWPRGITYGDLLVKVAAGHFNNGKPVKVRLLAWYNGYATNAKMNNLIGYTGWGPNLTSTQEAGLIGISLGGVLGGAMALAVDTLRTKSPETLRNDYCMQWWRDVLSGQYKNLEIRFRETDNQAVVSSLHSTDENNQEARLPGDSNGAYEIATEKMLLEQGAAHHQKPILIDYAHDQGRSAIGYVMGLNSITDYWDTDKHTFDDLRRERDFTRKTKAAKASKTVLALDPYRDYACRLEGDVLFDLNKNFEHGWNKAQKKTPNSEGTLARPKPAALTRRPSSKGTSAFHGQAQILRTQPDASTRPDKTIKEIYLHVSETAIHYLYVENQYFFYQEWADHLKAARRKFLEGEARACLKPTEAQTLHLFIVAPLAEDAGFIPRMYDTAKSLGLGQAAMPKQADKVEGEIDRHDAFLKKAAEGARASKTNLAAGQPALSDIRRASR